MSQRLRKPNYSKEETDALLDQLILHGSILFSKFQPINNQRRADIWATIAAQVNAVPNSAGRTVDELKHRWQDLSQRARHFLRSSNSLQADVKTPLKLVPFLTKIMQVLSESQGEKDGIASFQQDEEMGDSTSALSSDGSFTSDTKPGLGGAVNVKLENIPSNINTNSNDGTTTTSTATATGFDYNTLCQQLSADTSSRKRNHSKSFGHQQQTPETVTVSLDGDHGNSSPSGFDSKEFKVKRSVSNDDNNIDNMIKNDDNLNLEDDKTSPGLKRLRQMNFNYQKSSSSKKSKSKRKLYSSSIPSTSSSSQCNNNSSTAVADNNSILPRLNGFPDNNNSLALARAMVLDPDSQIVLEIDGVDNEQQEDEEDSNSRGSCISIYSDSNQYQATLAPNATATNGGSHHHHSHQYPLPPLHNTNRSSRSSLLGYSGYHEQPSTSSAYHEGLHASGQEHHYHHSNGLPCQSTPYIDHHHHQHSSNNVNLNSLPTAELERRCVMSRIRLQDEQRDYIKLKQFKLQLEIDLLKKKCSSTLISDNTNPNPPSTSTTSNDHHLNHLVENVNVKSDHLNLLNYHGATDQTNGLLTNDINIFTTNSHHHNLNHSNQNGCSTSARHIIESPPSTSTSDDHRHDMHTSVSNHSSISVTSVRSLNSNDDNIEQTETEFLHHNNTSKIEVDEENSCEAFDEGESNGLDLNIVKKTDNDDTDTTTTTTTTNNTVQVRDLKLENNETESLSNTTTNSEENVDGNGNSSFVDLGTDIKTNTNTNNTTSEEETKPHSESLNLSQVKNDTVSSSALEVGGKIESESGSRIKSADDQGDCLNLSLNSSLCGKDEAQTDSDYFLGAVGNIDIKIENETETDGIENCSAG